MRTIVILIFFFTTLVLFAQKNVEFKKDNFPNQKTELKQALSDIKYGDYYYQKGRQNIDVALEYYTRANDFNPNNTELNYKIAKCYLRSRPERLALVYLERYKKLKQGSLNVNYYLTLGQAYQRNLMFDKALKSYAKFKSLLSPEQLRKYQASLNRYFSECELSKEMIANPVRVFIDNLGSAVNSEYADYWPVINVDETRLYFTSRRSESIGNMMDETDEQYYEDIYSSVYKNDYWYVAQNIGSPINTEGHDAVVGRSPDGQILLIYRNTGHNGGDIYFSKLHGNQWSKPKAFPKPINSPYHESSASFSYDGRRIYFVSNRPGGFGGKDIYYCEVNEKGKWGKAVNLGNTVNTKKDEIGVFMHADGKTLYFSSNGHIGMGNFDVYRTVLEDGIWSVPFNLGYPINTYDPDAFFSIAANGRHAYYSTIREGGMGGHDIYRITFLGVEKPIVDNIEDRLLWIKESPIVQSVVEDLIPLDEPRLILLKGQIVGAEKHRPIQATIELWDNEKNKVLANFESNRVSGKYVVSLPAGRNYGIVVRAKGYLFHSENFVVSDTSTYQEVVVNITLEPVIVGSQIRLNNIFFAFQMSDLNPESLGELERILKLMNDYPKLKIEVSGHTDNMGDRAYNLKLSQQRAKAVADYLISNGIDKSRISYVGYGFDRPVSDNNSAAGRKLNRRCEIKIIGD